MKGQTDREAKTGKTKDKRDTQGERQYSRPTDGQETERKCKTDT